MTYCSECVHYTHGDEPRCMVRTAYFPGFLHPACDKFAAGDFRKVKEDYLKDLVPITTKPKNNRFMDPNTPQTKVCKKCGRELPLEAFCKHPKSADGLHSICRECKKQGMLDYYARMKKIKENPEIPAEIAPKGEKPEPDKPEPADLMVPDFSDEFLAAELRRRGYQVKATKTTVIEL